METHVAAAVRGSHHLTTAIMLMLEKYVVIFFLSQYSTRNYTSACIQDYTFYISYQEENKVVSEWVRIRLCLTKFIFHHPFFYNQLDVALNIVDPTNLQDAHIIIPVHSRWLCLPFYLSIKHSWERVWPLKLWILGLDAVGLLSFLCPIPVPWYKLCYPKKVLLEEDSQKVMKFETLINADTYMYKDFVH